MTSKVTKVHPILALTQHFYLSLSLLLSIFLSGVIVHNIKYDLKGHMRPLLNRVILKFQIFDQITTLTYVLMKNFCPCLLYKITYAINAIIYMINEIMINSFSTRGVSEVN